VLPRIESARRRPGGHDAHAVALEQALRDAPDRIESSTTSAKVRRSARSRTPSAIGRRAPVAAHQRAHVEDDTMGRREGCGAGDAADAGHLRAEFLTTISRLPTSSS